MIYWEQESLDDREAIFEFLYELNPKLKALLFLGVEKLRKLLVMAKLKSC